MGCTSSTEHPSIYNETIGKEKQTNGHVIKTPIINTHHMRGDYSQFQLAKHNREKHQKDRRSEIFRKADEMSERIIEERELLSLGTRSRGTSRATSRTASPNSNKRQIKEDHTTPMTPVAEFIRGDSHRSFRDESLERDQVDIVEGESNNNKPKPVKKHKRGKQTKSKTKGKKQRKVKGKKSKTEKVSFKDDVESDDSGLEDNNNIQAEDDGDDEDIENVKTEPETEVKRGEEDTVITNSALTGDGDNIVKNDKVVDESNHGDTGSVPIATTTYETVQSEVMETDPTDNAL